MFLNNETIFVTHPLVTDGLGYKKQAVVKETIGRIKVPPVLTWACLAQSVLLISATSYSMSGSWHEIKKDFLAMRLNCVIVSIG